MLLSFDALPIGTVSQHVYALKNFSGLDIVLAHVGMLNRFRFDTDRFDVIIFHYSIVIAEGFYIGAELRARLSASKALKVLFIQDEYRWIDATAEAIRELGISVIFTVVNSEAVNQIYHHAWLKNVRKEVTLAGFVDEKLLELETPSYEERKLDVVYRGRRLPYWLGSFAMEKWYIGEKFRKDADRFDLSCDISSDEQARMYGSEWIEFLAGAKAVLATESGASICDFSGELRIAVEAAVSRCPEIDFSTIHQQILGQSDGRIVINVISPRIFEAAALRTLMINYPGEYSGCLIPWRHYVPLAKDHSNIEEVVAVIRNPAKAKEIIEAAYREVACHPNNSFRAMVEHFDRVAFEELGPVVSGDKILQTAHPSWHFLELASWIYFYGWPIIERGRIFTLTFLRNMLPKFVRDWIKKRFLQ